MDIDALVKLSEPEVEAFVGSLAAHQLKALAEDLHDALKGEGHVSVFDASSPIHVDIKLAIRPEEIREVDHAEQIAFAQGQLCVARPEDVVAYKLVFGSPQDLADARSILVRQKARLDWRALNALCSQLGVTGDLDKLLAEIGRASSNLH